MNFFSIILQAKWHIKANKNKKRKFENRPEPKQTEVFFLMAGLSADKQFFPYQR